MSGVRGRGLGDGKTGVRSASVGERRKLEALVSIRLLEAIRSKDLLKALMSGISRKSRERGLTSEILLEILNDR